MSTKATIKYREATAGQPGFHLYDDVLDSLGSEEEVKSPVYLRLDGVPAVLKTLESGGASVTIVLPRGVARELGLLPTEIRSSAAADLTR